MSLVFCAKNTFRQKDIHISTKSGALCAAKVLIDDKAAYFKLSKVS